MSRGITMVRIMGMSLLLFVCLSYIPYEIESKSWSPPKACIPSGVCTMCDFTEEREDYCMETRRRQEYICRSNDEEELGEGPDESMPSVQGGLRAGSLKINTDRSNDIRDAHHHVLFHSCDSTPEDDERAVVWFEIWMFAIGCLSLWGVHIQKSKHLTLYESRLEKSANKQSRSFRIQDKESKETELNDRDLSSSGTLRRGRSQA